MSMQFRITSLNTSAGRPSALNVDQPSGPCTALVQFADNLATSSQYNKKKKIIFVVILICY